MTGFLIHINLGLVCDISIFISKVLMVEVVKPCHFFERVAAMSD